MSTSSEQIRAYAGPAILSYGFRPFFLFGALWSALAMALWLALLSGRITLPTALAPIEWHVHEMLFGYVPAVVAGFLLTAVPNWTGRLPVVGTPLLLLFLAWLAGRLAMLVSQWIGPVPAAIVDLAFLLALGGVIAREIVAAGNTRNLKVLVMVGLLAVGNGVFHAEAITGAGRGYGIRLGIGATVLLIMLIGGRIVPSFTRNWLARRGPGRLPTTVDRFDMAVMAVSAIALASFVALPDGRATGLLALVAFLLNGVRLLRWSGERTLGEPLVAVLHVAYAFIPIGFGLLALANLRPELVSQTGALHGWTAGAIGLMTLAVMTRASLGHTGQPLTATTPIALLYVAAVVAALARIVAAFGLLRDPMLLISGAAWIAAFGGFVVIYAPLLARSRA